MDHAGRGLALTCVGAPPNIGTLSDRSGGDGARDSAQRLPGSQEIADTMMRTGRHFLQIPGPTNVPDRVLRAMDMPTIDHRGPEFARLGLEVLEGLKSVFQTQGKVIIYPSSGTGACEAALVNTLSPGDRVLVFETGQFSNIWVGIAERLGLSVGSVPGNWRRGASAADAEARLAADSQHSIKAVVVVHNETSTGVRSRVAEIRKVIDQLRHPALLIVDAISSLGAMDYRHDEWGVDVTVTGSQKGLMVPPGLGFNAVSEKALAAGQRACLAKSYWDWQDMLKHNQSGFFPYTPATNLLYALREALHMLHEEGLPNVFRRHERYGEATRAAVKAWGLDIVCEEPLEYSSVLTAVFTPEGHSADALRKVILENYDMALGAGLGKLTGRAFRIGHMGSFNDLMLAGTLSGIEMGMRLAGVPHQEGGVMAALQVLVASLAGAAQPSAGVR
jgi:alanine-glyoxylate transaminase/serine-glyoxylate transaminase/serine-pyruvate transaminase